MRKVFIIKVGSTMPALRSKKGDFEDWILAGLKVGHEAQAVVDVRNGCVLPGYDEIAGIVITGSHAMVTEHQAWSERTAVWLAGGVGQGIPILGICYGHQLLAYALGGEVGNNPNGWEFGTVEVHLAEKARQDALLGGFSTPIKVQVSHTQSVLRLPGQAQQLAYSARDPNQTFVVGDCVWGVQFHPEFDAEVVRAYIHSYQEELSGQGQDPADLAATSVETSYGTEILRRFGAIVQARI
ncbi:MAG: glutamine amidotransferase [Chloroflexota bacterium]